MTLRIAIGPFDPTDPGADWPVVGCETLAPEFEVLPFAGEVPPRDMVDALIVWSPEYAGYIGDTFPGFAVAVVGDHHVVPFEAMPWLSNYDLICADLAGVKKLRALGYPPDKLLPFRQFSFDPRLHYTVEPDADNPSLREIDVCFMGRDVPVRRPMVDALRAWGEHTGRRVHIETDYPRGREADIYRRAKIAWRFAQRDELPMGVYEAAACGALAVLQHGALSEIIKASYRRAPYVAPIPTYNAGGGSSRRDFSPMTAFLERWLDDADARTRQVAAQQQWVKTETPAHHLGWLCRQIAERSGDGGRATRGGRAAAAGGVAGGDGDVGAVEAPAGLVAAGVPEPSPSERRTQCLDLLPPTGVRRVLDIGCGTGGAGWELRQRHPAVDVTGVDADERVADLAKARLTRFVQASVEVGDDHPLWATLREFGPYDAILCLDVLEHLFDPWATLKRLRPLLTGVGVLIASIPNLRNASTLHELLVNGDFRYFIHGRQDFRGPSDNVLSWEHLRFFTKRTAVGLLQDTGYAVELCEPTPFLMPGEVAARWRADLGRLVQTHGGLAERLDEELLVIQWLLRARPNWEAAV